MSLALPALLVFFLSLPGFSFTKGLNSSNERAISLPLLEQILRGLLISIPFHLLSFPCSYAFDLSPALDSVFCLLSGKYGPADKNFLSVQSSIASYPIHIFSYFTIVCSLAYYSGKYFDRNWIYYHKKLPFLYPANLWAKLFTDAFVENEYDGLFVAAIVDHSDHSYLYVGIFDDYSLSKDGSLNNIVLKYARRRVVGSDRESAEDQEHWLNDQSDYYPIKGDALILSYKQVRTINVYYFTMDKESD